MIDINDISLLDRGVTSYIDILPIRKKEFHSLKINNKSNQFILYSFVRFQFIDLQIRKK